MPAYAYTGLNNAGKTIKGIETAESVGALKGALKRKGVYLTAVTETSAAAAATSAEAGITLDLSSIFDRVNNKTVAEMTRMLSTLLCAGVTLPESLVALTDQSESARFKGILGDIGAKVNEGSSLADAMASHPNVFSTLYINMIRAGESSGALETVLIRIADFMDKQEEIKSKVGTAMVYPILMGLVGFGVVALLMVQVVPNLAELFADQDMELPLTTTVLMFLSDIVSKTWWLLLGLGIGSIFVFRAWRRSENGRRLGDLILLRTPLVGDLARKLAIGRFARTLSTMLASGVNLLEALEIVRSLLGNVILEDVVSAARDDIREGEGVAPALKRSGEFPPLVTHMIAVGERSGQLEQMLGELAEAYDRETNAAITRATAALEPLMIVTMAGVVGFIVFSIMSPIMQMNASFGG